MMSLLCGRGLVDDGRLVETLKEIELRGVNENGSCEVAYNGEERDQEECPSKTFSCLAQLR